jgi:hypothetical protein
VSIPNNWYRDIRIQLFSIPSYDIDAILELFAKKTLKLLTITKATKAEITKQNKASFNSKLQPSQNNNPSEKQYITMFSH